MPPKEGADSARADQSVLKEDVKQGEKNKKILAMIGATGADHRGEVHDLISGGTPAASLEEAFAGAGGLRGGVKIGSSISSKSGRVAMVSTKVLNTSAISSAHVRRELRRSSRQVQYCYQRQLRHDNKLSGEVSVRGVVNARGRFESMQLLGNSVHPAVGVCVQNVLKRFHFKMSTATGLTPALVIEQSWRFQP